MLNVSVCTDEIETAVQNAAEQAQAYLERERGTHYRIDDLKKAFVTWLEQSVEQLAEEAMYHAFEGQHTYTFNRRGFLDALKKCEGSDHPADADAKEVEAA